MRAASATPEAFVQSLADEALTLLQRPELGRADREAAFRQLFRKGFDIDRIARFALGRYWRKATAAERRDYRAVFEVFVVKTYSGRLSLYSGETFKVTGAAKKGKKDTLVESVVVRPTGPGVRVDWRVRGNPGGYRVIDVAIEGVSMLVTQRSEFATVIRNGGGRVDSLIAALRERVAKME